MTADYLPGSLALADLEDLENHRSSPRATMPAMPASRAALICIPYRLYVAWIVKKRSPQNQSQAF